MKFIVTMLLVGSVVASQFSSLTTTSTSRIRVNRYVTDVSKNNVLLVAKNKYKLSSSCSTKSQQYRSLNTPNSVRKSLASFVEPTSKTFVKGSRCYGNQKLTSVSLLKKQLFPSHMLHKKDYMGKPKYPQYQYFQSTSLSSTSSSTSSTTTSTTNNNEDEETHSNYITTKHKADKFHNQIDQESNSIKYPKGIPEGFYIVKQYKMPDLDTVNDMIQNAIDQTTAKKEQNNQILKNDNEDGNNVVMDEKVGLTQVELDRLGITDGGNITLPIALMLLDPIEFPSFSKARKACRKGYIILHRGPLDSDENNDDNDDDTKIDDEDITIPTDGDCDENDHGVESSKDDGIENSIFNLDKCIRGRVGDRVYPNDVIGRQVRMHGGFYPGLESTKPPFDLPVVYEDDHFAIVNKPAGIVVYSQRKQGHGMMTVRAALPFVLRPPKRGTLAIIRRPVSVHRLDKPTAGLLIIAKTKPAMVDITKQFVERRVKKTYTAILSGIPDEPIESRLTTLEAHQLGVDVGDISSMSEDELQENKWQIIDSALDDGNSVKSAVTVWKPLEYIKSLKANNGILTKVEMKPKTGRYHQLRRHMAWVKDCPMIGDKVYDGGSQNAMDLRGRGLFLCSNKVQLDHPYYNTEIGRKEWNNLPEDEKWGNGMIEYSEADDIVQVCASIELPGKFESFLKSEQERANKFEGNATT